PYIGINHNTDFFIEYLDRLADTYPKEVGEITLTVVKSDRPDYDFEGRFQSIIKKILATDYYDLSLQICKQPSLMEMSPISAHYNEFSKKKESVRIGDIGVLFQCRYVIALMLTSWAYSFSVSVVCQFWPFSLFQRSLTVGPYLDASSSRSQSCDG